VTQLEGSLEPTQPSAGFRSPTGLRKLLPPLVFLAIVAVVWQFGAMAAHNILLPTFTATIIAFVAIMVDGSIWEPLARSNLTMVIGFVASVVIGLPLGLLMGRRPFIDRLVAPYVSLLVVVPAAPLLPIIVMMIGFGLQAGVLVVMLFTVVYIVVNTRAGIRSIDQRLVEMAISYGASEVNLWRYVLIPGALPAIGTGLRIGLGRAFAGMILGELLLFSSGIGLLILFYRSTNSSDHVFAVVLVLMIEALVIGYGMRRLERKLQPPAA
jgi:ABC-type nitrate/sulfonate/bicarbonate transport system permease component